MFMATPEMLFAEETLKDRPEKSTWFGLYKNDENYVVKEVEMTIESVPNAITNLMWKNSMGKRVLYNTIEQPLFLLKNVPGISPGIIFSGKVSEPKGDKIKKVAINYNEKEYQFCYEIRTKNNDHINGGYTQSFERTVESVGIEHRYSIIDGGKEQELSCNFPKNGRGHFSGGEIFYVTGSKVEIEKDLNNMVFENIIFAGDLDKDGHLDIVLNQAFRGFNYVLYLSSYAEDKDFVGKVISFKYFDPNKSGC